MAGKKAEDTITVQQQIEAGKLDTILAHLVQIKRDQDELTQWVRRQVRRSKANFGV